MIIYSWFTYYKWWFSKAMLVYHKVIYGLQFSHPTPWSQLLALVGAGVHAQNSTWDSAWWFTAHSHLKKWASHWGASSQIRLNMCTYIYMFVGMYIHICICICIIYIYICVVSWNHQPAIDILHGQTQETCYRNVITDPWSRYQLSYGVQRVQ